jgi:para-aminobenzoate synthetase component 1
MTPFQLYCRLRAINPAPFAAYLNYDNFVIASASPERFLKLDNAKIETRPIKGTRRRAASQEEDKKLAQALQNSEKDKAENIMIVDLLRNDLSKICKDNTVNVSKLCELETFSNIHHLVSVVTGELAPDKNAIDLLEAAFPGGSITGAPKIRAMEIIAEIEPTARGPYCGCIGYISCSGDMDTAIVIRTYAIKNNIIIFQAGGGVVADSIPENEYQEALTKAYPLIIALTENIQ